MIYFCLYYFVLEPNDPRKVIVKKLALVVEGRDDMELDLTGDLSQLKKQASIFRFLTVVIVAQILY